MASILETGMLDEQMTRCTELFTTWFGLDLLARYSNRKDLITVVQRDAPVTMNVSADMIIVRAPMGSGKTTALITWLKNLNVQCSILVISCRRTFACELFKRFTHEGLETFELYSNIDDRFIDRPRLIVQIESLYRTTSTYDVVILDEVVSIINQFYSSTMKNIDTVDRRFIDCITKCKYLLAMDATINGPLVDFLLQYRGERCASLILNSYVADNFSRRLAVLLSCFSCDDHVSFMNILLENVENRKKICVFVSTISAANYLQTIIDERYPETTVLKLTSKERHETVDSWDRYDVVIYNTVITVGISFDKVYFHSLFVYIQLFRNGPDIMSIYQSIGRVRHLIENRMYIYINPIMIKKSRITSPLSLFPTSYFMFEEWQINAIDTSIEGFTNKCRYGERFRSTSTVRNTFKRKYLLEKTILNNLSDSLTLLYLLLKNNNISIFSNCIAIPFTLDQFWTFIKTAVEDCRPLGYAQVIERRPLRPEFIEIVSSFSEKFFSPRVRVSVLVSYVQKLKYEDAKHAFINSLFCFLKIKNVSSEYLTNVYRQISQMTIASDENCDYVYTLGQSCVLYDEAFLQVLAGLGADIVKKLKLRSCTDVTTDIEESDMIFCAVKHADQILKCLQCAFTTHIQCFEALNPRTLRLYYDLKGMNLSMLTMSEYCLSLLKTWFRLVYNMSIVQSQSRYDIRTSSSKLTKKQLQTILEDKGVDYSMCTTHRQLRSLLRTTAGARSKQIYKLRGTDVCSLFKDDIENEQWIRDSDQAM